MYETDMSIPATFDDYAAEVDATWRREDHDPQNWRDNYADLVRGEFGELMHQHGVGYTFLNELEDVKDQANDTTELIAGNKDQYDGLIEELGDLLWFSFRTAAELGIDPKRASADALSQYTRTSHNFQTFSELEKAMIKSAEFIAVLSKRELRHPESLDSSAVKLRESPSYVLMRMVFRLGRALDNGRSDYLGPPTASMLEPLPDLSQSVGDCINVVAYISRDLLEIPTEEVARRNIHKLQQRAIHGKSKPAE